MQSSAGNVGGSRGGLPTTVVQSVVPAEESEMLISDSTKSGDKAKLISGGTEVHLSERPMGRKATRRAAMYEDAEIVRARRNELFERQLKVDEKNAESLKEIAEMMLEFNAARKWSEEETVTQTADQPELQNRAKRIRTSRTMRYII
jgi:hypothetical protein